MKTLEDLKTCTIAGLEKGAVPARTLLSIHEKAIKRVSEASSESGIAAAIVDFTVETKILEAKLMAEQETDSDGSISEPKLKTFKYGG